MLNFTTEKLLGGHSHIETNTSDTLITPTDQSIACLSVRFPLEFDFSNPNAQILVRKQIEHHMRLCTIASSGFDTLFSTVGSEPLLAEAASHFMTESETSPIRELSRHLDKNCINHGKRGELVAVLLIMQARDALSRRSMGERSVNVCQFLETLLGPSFVHTAMTSPSKVHSEDYKKSLADNFNDARIWFNHVLKIRKTKLINVQHLWKFLTRGAMILCANNQPGVDIVIPVCLTGNLLSPLTTTAIIIQVKNSSTFGERIRGYLFDAMDPFEINLFDKGMDPRPIIRMVFALASEVDVVKYADGPPRTTRTTQSSQKLDKYTSYDIWCAGISQKIFPVIRDNEVTPYRQILDRTRFPGQEYAVGKIHKIKYPDEVEKEKIELLRCFDAPVWGEEDPKGGS